MSHSDDFPTGGVLTAIHCTSLVVSSSIQSELNFIFSKVGKELPTTCKILVYYLSANPTKKNLNYPFKVCIV